MVPAGSQVTAAFGTAANAAFLTFVAIEPGDSLTAIDSTSAVTPFSEPVAVTTLPPSPPDGGTNYYVNAGPCGSGGNALGTVANFTVDSQDGCEAAGKFPLLATVTDVNGVPLAFASQSVAVAGDGGLDDAGAQAVSMTGDTWMPFASLPLSVTNAPSNRYYFFALSQVSDYVPYFQSVILNQATGGAGQAAIPLAAGYGDFDQTEVSFEPSFDATTIGTTPNGGNVSAIATRTAATPAVTASAFDLSTIPPLLTNAIVDYSNASRPSVTWSSAAPLTSVDGVIAFMGWSTETTNGAWTFVVPPTMTIVQAPALPGTLVGPASGDDFGSPTVLVLEATFWSGYPAFRGTLGAMPTPAQAGALSNCAENDVNNNTGNPCIVPLPADGTLRMTAFTTFEGD